MVNVPCNVGELQQCMKFASRGDVNATQCLNALQQLSPPANHQLYLELLHTSGICYEDQFMTLTALGRMLFTSSFTSDVELHGRMTLRQWLLSSSSSTVTSDQPKYLLTKKSVLLAKCMQYDLFHGWPHAFDECIQLLLPNNPQFFFQLLIAFHEEVVQDIRISSQHDEEEDDDEETRNHNMTKLNTIIKDVMRGYYIISHYDANTQTYVKTANNNQNAMQNGDTIVGKLVWISLSTFLQQQQQQQQTSDALQVITNFCSWIDLSLLFSSQKEKNLPMQLLHCIQQNNPTNCIYQDDDDPDPPAALAIQSLECILQILNRLQDDTNNQEWLKFTLQYNLPHFLLHESKINWSTVDATHINVVLKATEIITTMGLHLLDIRNQQQDNNEINTKLFEPTILLFLHAFSYDDIDVSGAVVPLAMKILSSKQHSQNKDLLQHLVQILFQQMPYPADFEYDYQNDIDAEEVMYRDQYLRNVYKKLIQIYPEDTLLQLTAFVTSHSTFTKRETHLAEASLRLIYHYCEGYKGGLKALKKNCTSFSSLLQYIYEKTNIHFHPHSEVQLMYYNVVTRYSYILQLHPEYLPNILSGISGENGIQHSQHRVRSRCSYLLLKLVKSLGKTMRPYVETAITGILGLLSTIESNLSKEDDEEDDTILYLFETIGLLLGRTGLDTQQKEQYITAAMTPHVQSMNQTLQQLSQQQQQEEGEHQKLCQSISAIAYLSKGFTKPIPVEVQNVLSQTIPICYNVLQTFPTEFQIRNKIMIYLQRMIQSLDHNSTATILLGMIPQYTLHLIPQSTPEDILDVAQLLCALITKYKSSCVEALDSSLLPFLQKIHTITSTSTDTSGIIPRHMRTEQISIQKLSFQFLFTMVSTDCTNILLSTTNIGSLQDIFNLMGNGALQINDPIIQRTCILFFRHLLSQWDNQIQQQHLELFYQYLLQIFLPGIVQAMLRPTFLHEDALFYRCICEISSILHILKQNHHSLFLNISLPPDVIESMKQPSNEKEMQTCLVAIIQMHKQKKQIE